MRNDNLAALLQLDFKNPWSYVVICLVGIAGWLAIRALSDVDRRVDTQQEEIGDVKETILDHEGRISALEGIDEERNRRGGR